VGISSAQFQSGFFHCGRLLGALKQLDRMTRHYR
jgi:hypothetical protein